jgi:hypothetical protein
MAKKTKTIALTDQQKQILTVYWARLHQAQVRATRWYATKSAVRARDDAYRTLNDMVLLIGGEGATCNMTPEGPEIHRP